MLVHMKQNSQVNQLAEAVAQLNSVEETVEFLRGILTPKELAEIAQRLQIVKMLKKGVGIATVTRGSKELKKGRFNDV
jgi:TrpR family transcriptional regulator, trp operon repressor